jgi:serine/threonine-protein phosphatase 6 regulatory subunit 3
MEHGQPPLNPLLSSFFSKAFGVLITRKSEQNWYSYQYNCVQVFEFLKKKDLVADLLRHIGTSAISDLILRLITCVDGTEIKQSLLDVSNMLICFQIIIEIESR